MTRTRGAARQRSESRGGADSMRRSRRRVDHVERRGDRHPAAQQTTQTTDSFQLFLNEASRYPLLTREEEVELAKRIEHGDLDAKERLINSNLRLVIKFARRYQGHGLSLQDLVQEAMLGLIRAAEKFDWRRGYKFSTYAVLWIKQAIQRGLDNTGRPVRIPAHVAHRERAVDRTEAELSAKLNREPTEEEVADRGEAAPRGGQGGAGSDPGHDQPGCPRGRRRDRASASCTPRASPSVGDEIVERQQEQAVSAALGALPEDERRVIQLRFGTGGEAETPLRDAARELGVSQDRARQLEAKGLRRLAADGSLAAWRAAA